MHVTALLAATEYGHAGCAEVLLDANADVDTAVSLSERVYVHGALCGCLACHSLPCGVAC